MEYKLEDFIEEITILCQELFDNEWGDEKPKVKIQMLITSPTTFDIQYIIEGEIVEVVKTTFDPINGRIS